MIAAWLVKGLRARKMKRMKAVNCRTGLEISAAHGAQKFIVIPL